MMLKNNTTIKVLGNSENNRRRQINKIMKTNDNHENFRNNEFFKK